MGYDETCEVTGAQGHVKVQSYVDVIPNDVDQLKAALEIGPVSVAIQANQPAFQFYKSGIIDDSSCGTVPDHGVLAVGYGIEGDKEYFIIKNSWGPSWGEKGYAKIAALDSNVCGILSQPSYPVVV